MDWDKMWNWIEGVSTILVASGIVWAVSTVVTVKEKVALLMARPHVDPIQYTEAMTKLTSAISNFTEAYSKAQSLHEERHKDLKEEVDDIKQKIDRLLEQRKVN